MNEYDEFAADLEGKSLDEIERLWHTPDDECCNCSECRPDLLPGEWNGRPVRG